MKNNPKALCGGCVKYYSYKMHKRIYVYVCTNEIIIWSYEVCI